MFWKQTETNIIKKGFDTCGGDSVEEVKINDKLKKELALKNDIKEDNYIIIDCRKSELKWIKDSVMKSDLPNLLHFKEDDIDWLECGRYATKNIVKEVCNYKNNNPNYNVLEMSKIFKVAISTIKRYLKEGMELGWCNL